MRIHGCTYTYRRTHADTNVQLHTKHTYARCTHVQFHTRTYARTRVRSHTLHTHVDTHLQLHAHTHTHLQLYTHTDTHTHAISPSLLSPFPCFSEGLNHPYPFPTRNQGPESFRAGWESPGRDTSPTGRVRPLPTPGPTRQVRQAAAHTGYCTENGWQTTRGCVLQKIGGKWHVWNSTLTYGYCWLVFFP